MKISGRKYVKYEKQLEDVKVVAYCDGLRVLYDCIEVIGPNNLSFSLTLDQTHDLRYALDRIISMCEKDQN